MLMRNIKIKQEDCAPFSDMLKIVGHRAKITPKTVERVYKELVKYIIEELHFREAVYLRNIGYFGTIPTGGYMKKMPAAPGSSVVVEKYIEPQCKVRFKPTREFEKRVSAPVGEKEPEKKPTHKRGELIEQDSALKKERRALVKTMLKEEGHKLHDPRYAEKQLETLDFTDVSELEVFAENYED